MGRSEVRNVEDDVESFTPAEREELEEDDDSPSDVLERGYGTPLQINMLFGAMASAAGFEARWAFLSDRSEFLFNPELSEGYFLRYGVIAVREEEEWRFFDPASRYVPYGMLQWRHEGVTALVTDRREPVFVSTPIALPGNSIERRSAEMRLDMDGSLEGHVRIVRTGHIGAAMKESYDALSAAEREERLINTLRNRLPTAEVRSVEIENAADPELPLMVSYDVRIPGYGQRTGQRLFFMPAFFQQGLDPLLETSERRYDLFFDHPWSEEDSVVIRLPEAFTIENADAPSAVNAGVAQYGAEMILDEDGTLHYERGLSFGHQGAIAFSVDQYPLVKQVFDAFADQDNYVIALRSVEAR